MAHIINQSLHQRLEHIQALEYNTIGSFYVADAQGTYLACNATQLKWIGLNTADELIGKSTQETPWEQHSNQYEWHNQAVMQDKRAHQYFEYAFNDNELIFAISHKEPFYHQDKLVGIQGRSLRIPYNQINCCRPFSDETVFIDTHADKLLTISERKRESLFLLLKGFNVKEIAERRKLSRRTIEHHIEHIRNDNNYRTIADILLRVRAF